MKVFDLELYAVWTLLLDLELRKYPEIILTDFTKVIYTRLKEIKELFLYKLRGFQIKWLLQNLNKIGDREKCGYYEII